MRAYAETDNLEMMKMNKSIEFGDKDLQKMWEDQDHLKFLGIKVNKDENVAKEKLMHRAFKFYSSQVVLCHEEKLNLIERELVQIYKRKNLKLLKRVERLMAEMEAQNTMIGFQK